MKITQITTDVVGIALKTPFVTALRRVDEVEFVHVKISCDNGLIGVGEAPATVAITGEGIYEILNSIAFVKEELTEEEVVSALQKLHASNIGSSAKAALDMAMFSLLVQQQKQTLTQFFGLKDEMAIYTDVTISLGSSERMLQAARVAIAEGMNIFKVKVAEDISHAISVSRQIVEQFPDAKVLIDANQAWSEEQSLEYLKGVQGLKIELLEQPVRADDLLALQSVTKHSDIPILADEAVFTLEDAKTVVENNCADMINIKLMKCGGVTKAIEILEYARKNKVTCMLGSMLEGPVSINAALYLAFAYTDVIKYVDLDSPLLYKELPDSLDFVYKGSQITPCCQPL